MAAPSPSTTLDLVRSGVEAIVSTSADIEGSDWFRTVATDWNAAEMARHVLAVSRWYHSWLDAAVGGHAEPPFPSDQLDDRNELMIHELRHVSGPEAIRLFAASAHAYVDRLADNPNLWDIPFGFPVGRATPGEHAAFAAAEWHLHAWDLSHGSYEPRDAATLFTVTAHSFAAQQPTPLRMMTRVAAPVVAKRDPWSKMLARTGRA